MAYSGEKEAREARREKIIRPQKPYRNSHFDQWVTKDSGFWQRKHYVQLRRYQSYECNDGMRMDTSDDCWRDFVGYSFLAEYFDERIDDKRSWLIGTAGFTHKQSKTTLEYCWIHPFWRGEGLLKHAWPSFIERFGEFYVSEPRTNSMRGFLQSVGYQDPSR